MKMRSILLLALVLVAGVAGAQVLTQSWTSIRVGPSTSGTELNLIEGHTLAFTGDTTSTATTAVTGTYYVSGAWTSLATGSDPTSWTLAVSNGVLTATTTASTTGTLSAIVFGAP